MGLSLLRFTYSVLWCCTRLAFEHRVKSVALAGATLFASAGSSLSRACDGYCIACNAWFAANRDDMNTPRNLFLFCCCIAGSGSLGMLLSATIFYDSPMHSRAGVLESLECAAFRRIQRCALAGEGLPNARSRCRAALQRATCGERGRFSRLPKVLARLVSGFRTSSSHLIMALDKSAPRRRDPAPTTSNFMSRTAVAFASSGLGEPQSHSSARRVLPSVASGCCGLRLIRPSSNYVPVATVTLRNYLSVGMAA